MSGFGLVLAGFARHCKQSIEVIEMFELIIVLILSVLVFHGHAQKRKREAIAAHQFISMVQSLQLSDDCFEEAQALEFQPITCIWERASAIALADEIIAACDQALEVSDFLKECQAIAPAPQPVQMPTNTATVRALCQLYDVPCSKRGRVNRSTRKRLAVAIAA